MTPNTYSQVSNLGDRMEPGVVCAVIAEMRRDGRTLDHATLETIRLMAVERVAEGETPSSVVESYGFNRTTIYKWISKALAARSGVAALGATVGSGRPRHLTPRQEQQVFRWVNGRDPRQYGLDFGLWTRAVVAELIERKFGVRLSISTVGSVLERLGLTPQNPCNAPISATRKRSSVGSASTTRALPHRPSATALRFCSGTSRAFGPMRCTARPGVCVARPRWSIARDSGSRSVRPRRSVRRGPSGTTRLPGR